MKVLMINSVGEHEAGTEVDLPDEEGDRFILLGYAEGELSREFDPGEIETVRAKHQAVTL